MSYLSTRRQFLHRAARTGLGAAGLALLGGCTVRPGQRRDSATASRVATIGYLAGVPNQPVDAAASLPNDLRLGLRDLGWVQGENLLVESRLARGDVADLPDRAAELAHMPVQLVVAEGLVPIGAMVMATRTLPIVMVQGPPGAVALGLAASLQHPGGNVTGLLQAPDEIYGKRLELLVEAVPRVSRVAYIVTGPASIGEALHEAARSLGVQVDIMSPQDERELELAFEAIDREGIEALLVAPNLLTSSHQAQIVAFAAERGLPSMFGPRIWAELGGLMSYSVDIAASYRRAAFYVDRILQGTAPGDLPIEAPTRYEMVINLTTAEALGITIPEAVLAQAAEVIR